MFGKIQPPLFALLLVSVMILSGCSGTSAPAGAPLQTPQSSVANLRGQYAVLSNSLLGSLTFDGQGNVNGEFPIAGTVTGTYTLGADGRGTAVLIGAAQPARNPTLSFVVLASGDVFFIETDSVAADPGLMRKQDPSAFSFAVLSGTYALGGLPVGYRSPCSFSTMTVETSGSITFTNANAPSESFPRASLDPVSGKVSLGTDSSGDLLGGNLYVVSRNEVFAQSTPPGQLEPGPCQAERQTGPYSTSAFSQPYTLIIPPSPLGQVFTGQQRFLVTGGDAAAAFTLANGAVQNGVIDQLASLNGPPLQQINQPITSGNFVINSDGTCSLTIPPNLSANCFAVSPDLAFLQVSATSPDSLGTVSVSGAMRNTHATTFATSSVAGAYAVLIAGIRRDDALVSSVARLSFDGNGNVSGTEDSNAGPGFIQNNSAVQGTYRVAANGRGTITLASSVQTSHYAIYVVSDSEFYLVGLDTDLITGFGQK